MRFLCDSLLQNSILFLMFISLLFSWILCQNGCSVSVVTASVSTVIEVMLIRVIEKKATKLITLDFCTGISKKIMSFFSLETSQLSFRGVLSCPIYDQEKLLHFLIFSRLIPYSFDWLYFACSAPRLQFGNSFGGRLARKFIECACYSSTFLSLTANFFQKSIFTQISVFSSFEFNAANRG